VRCRHDDRGQAVVEFALALPLVCALVMGVVQVGVVVRHQLAVQVAARAAARAASVSADASAAAVDGAHGAMHLRPISVEVEMSTLRTDDTSSSARQRTATAQIDIVAVTVGYTDPTDVPLIGLIIPSVELRATVTMAVEPP